MHALRRWMLKPLIYVAALAVTVLVTIVLVFAVQARLRLAELEPWHRTELAEEYRAGWAVETFAAYRALEDRLFEELRVRILEDPDAADSLVLGRFNPASEVARLAFDTPYNRSFELMPDGEIRGAVLLVHGLTDSPYSMRSLADVFLAQGFYVLALRLPGHGTLPAGLVDVGWEDWYGAVVVAAKHAALTAGPDRPFLIGGYSTGAALAALYAVRALDDPELPRPDGLYLLSAAIGISRFAFLTNVVSGLSFLPAFEKSRWLDVMPEYDPYKYNSFPVNAANQIYRLTRELRAALLEAAADAKLGAMPPVVVFQSIVDSTVTAAYVVQGLLSLLPSGNHELVVFDVNRSTLTQGLLAAGPLEDLERLRNATDMPFSITLIGSASPDSQTVAAYRREAGASLVTTETLPLAWPSGVFSLGHGALPIRFDDPVYGAEPAPQTAGFNLGSLALRGESGALVLPLGTFARLRSNPFFDVVRDTIVRTLPDRAAAAR